MRKLLTLTITFILVGLLVISAPGQTDPPDNNGGESEISRCDLAHSTCMNNANFVYAVCLAGGSAGCYEKAVQSYNTCMTSKDCTPKSELCFGAKTGTKACS